MKKPNHQYFNDPAMTRLLGTVTALAGEVFVLKAQNERLTRALLASGSLSPQTLTEAEEDPALSRWMAQEKDAFAAAILAPIIEPDMAQKRHDEIFDRGAAKPKAKARSGSR